MGKWHYYNEFDPFAAEWLRNLIKKGLIPDGEVDTRSIVDVRPDDVRGFVQCHYFAGIAGWPLALKFAGWPDDRPVWTGSCPCQPFSVAGKGKGTDDERHLWPAFHRLIRECRPAIVFGEQVASRAGREWLSGVFADLERVGYAGAGADLCAPGVGAPHIRQRLYWVALADADIRFGDERRIGLPRGAAPGESCITGEDFVADADCGGREPREPAESIQRCLPESGCNKRRDMADAESIGRRGRPHDEDAGRREQPSADSCAGSGDMADADDAGRQGRGVLSERADERSPWSNGVEWRRGADGKERRTKSGAALLVNGVSGGVALERTLPGGEKETHIYSRVGALRGFGNAIVPQLAAEFIKTFMSYGE